MQFLKQSVLISFLAIFVLTGGTLAAQVDLNNRIASVLPTPQEDAWLTIGWHTNLMQSRLQAQQSNRPLFVWLMNGHPLGCT